MSGRSGIRGAEWAHSWASSLHGYAHHIRHRSLGGGDELENLASLCAAHHLHGIHRGWVKVGGRAPDALVWELGAHPSA